MDPYLPSITRTKGLDVVLAARHYSRPRRRHILVADATSLSFRSPGLEDKMIRVSRKTRVFWPICLLLVLVDCTSKNLVVERLGMSEVSQRVAGEIVRFTLSFNRDAAMGLSMGAFSRIGFALAACVAIAVLAPVYRRTPPGRTSQLVALALICGGAAGNLIDRLRSARGVIDFIDVGFGAHRFWIFNLADAGLTIGATMLALLLWRADQEESSPPAHSHT